jgi:photosystem II stability/assembly factor-like uncharacterized protein
MKFKLYLPCLLMLIIGQINCFSQADTIQRDDSHEDMLSKLKFERLKIVDQLNDSIHFESYEKGLLKTNDLLNDFILKSISRRPTISQDNDDIFTWSEMGPADLGGRTRGIALKRISNTEVVAWAGGISGGLWENKNVLDIDSKWNLVDDSYMFVSTVDILEGSRNLLCYGTGEAYLQPYNRGNGVYIYDKDNANVINITPGVNSNYKQDSGKSMDFKFIYKVHFLKDGTLLVGTWKGLYRLPVNKKTWEKVLTFNDLPIFDIESDRQKNIYIGSYGEFWKSEDGGNNWIYLNRKTGFPRITFDRIEISISESNSKNIYTILAEGRNVKSIIRSKDGGESWSPCNFPPDSELNKQGYDFSSGQAWYALSIGVSEQDPNQVIIGGMNLHKSMDGGISWKQLSYWNNSSIVSCGRRDSERPNYQYVHADQHAIIFDKTDPSIGLFSNDGGVFLTKNALDSQPTIIEINKGYNISQLYSVGYHPIKPVFMAGTQDNGTRLFKSETLTKTDMAVDAWDGGICYIGQLNPNLQIASYIGNQYYVSRDGGVSYRCMYSPKKDLVFPNPTAIDEVNNILYSSSNNHSIFVWKNFNSSPSYEIKIDVLIPGYFSPSDIISFLKLSPNNPAVLYVGTSEGKLIRISGVNSTTPSVNVLSISPWGRGYISCIDVERNKEDHLLLTLSSYGVKSVWETQNSLLLSPTWTSITGDLLNIPVRAGLILGVGKTKIVLGTEVGIFTTSKTQGENTKWDYNSINLGKARVDMLAYRPSDKLLLAATHGRGLFSTKLEDRKLSPFATNRFKTFENMATWKNISTQIKYDVLENKLMFNEGSSNDIVIEERTSGKNIHVGAKELRNISLNSLDSGTYDIKIIKENGKILDKKTIAIKNN